jgi:RHS repeat-associated protein
MHLQQKHSNITYSGQFYYTHSNHTSYSLSTILGSITEITNQQAQLVQRMAYDAWGNRTLLADNTGTNQFFLDRGYTGHEHLDDFKLINMNGRLYDPILGRMLSPDNYVQNATGSQEFNRYSYCLNNPLLYTDPSGNFIFTALAIVTGQWWALPMTIGADVGMWQGGSMANGTMNPFKWDYSSGKTWGYMAGGAAVGAASGYVGGAIAAEGGFMANTMGIVASSYINSLGTSIYTGGKTDVSVSFGAGSYNFDTGEFSYLGKKGNSTLENIGYGFGALANLSDMVSLLRGGGQNIKVNSATTKDGHEWWGHSSITDENGNTLVSVGPDSQVQKAESLSQTWQNSIKGADVNWRTYLGVKGTWSVELNNVSTTAISKYASGITRWDLLLNSCVGHTTRALWSAGIPTIYAFHPHMLNLQLLIRQLGIYSSPYLYQIP